MYLRRVDIERILNKCGIQGYTELWLSSETNLRKDNGSVWKVFSEKYDVTECLHIGDNEMADIQLSGDYKIGNYHIMSSKDLAECSNLGELCNLHNVLNSADSVAKGLVLKNLFSNPFAINKTEFRVKVQDEQTFGYALMGPVILGYMNHLAKEMLESGTNRVFFFAREGYLLKDLFEIMKKYIPKLSSIQDEYLMVSRRALSVAAIETAEDAYELLNIFYRGTFRELLFYRFGISDSNAVDESLVLPEEQEKAKQLLRPYEARIMQQAEKERKSYMHYYAGLNNDDNGRTAVSDIGYSGSIQYYLSKLTGETFDGYYFATDAKNKPLAISGNSMHGHYIANDSHQDCSDSYVHRYHLILESILIAPTGQFVRVGDNGEFQYITDKNPQFTVQIEQIQEGIKQYFEDFYSFCGSDAMYYEIDKDFAEELTQALIECDVLEEKLQKCLEVDDMYCTDSKISAIAHYKDLEQANI